jgi:hypothetical protein
VAYQRGERIPFGAVPHPVRNVATPSEIRHGLQWNAT